MLTKNYKLLISTTTVSVLFGIVLAIAYITTNGQEEANLLVLVQYVLFSIFLGWLLALMLLVIPHALRLISQVLSVLELQKAYLPDEGHEWEMIRIRREMIALRLGVDDPCNCSKRRITCDYWSLCDGSPYSRIDHSTLAPGYIVNLTNKNNDAKPTSITRKQTKRKSTKSL